jgi:16S rRNA (guanine966-N2)-methyltransferase
MSIKIIGGVARGYPLATPRSDLTRPTSILVRRKLFDWRQSLEGESFIDLFAGSGAMGFEALSRGAEKVILNDLHKQALMTLKQNADRLVAAFKMDPKKIQVQGLDALKWVERELVFNFSDTSSVILYLDPPYENHALYHQVLHSLKAHQFQGEVWLEADRLKGPKIDELTGAFRSVIKKVEQGDHFVLIGKVV